MLIVEDVWCLGSMSLDFVWQVQVPPEIQVFGIPICCATWDKESENAMIDGSGGMRLTMGPHCEIDALWMIDVINTIRVHSSLKMK